MIAWFVRNTVAANLLMLAIVGAGLFVLQSGKIPLEVFPEYDSQMIEVQVPYRGANPEEVEEQISVKVEEAIWDVEGIEMLSSRSGEGSATVSVEVNTEYDRREVMEDIKNRIDAISTFPEDAEEPRVRLGESYRSVIGVILSAPLAERELKQLGEQVRDEIASLPGVSVAELQGVRPYEISIEVNEQALAQYGLRFSDVSQAIKSHALDVPAGSLETSSGAILLRTLGQAKSQQAFEEIPIRAVDEGGILTLGDVASVEDGFNENHFEANYNGKRCVLVAVSRQGNQNAIEIADRVKDYIEQRRDSLPQGAEINYWSDRSKIVKGRLRTLMDSAAFSIVLVLVVLMLFLRLNLALWVTLGIPISFLGAFALMPLLGVSINIVSLFGFILVLGIVVDDAIVTGENIFRRQRLGMKPEEAAIVGTKEVSTPVIFGVLTTVIAFTPLLFIEGGRGNWMGVIALVVIPVLLLSLVESKLILPAHLKHIAVPARKDSGSENEAGTPSKWMQLLGWVADATERFVERVYEPFLKWALHWRYAVTAVFIVLLLLAFGWVQGGYISYVPFPRIPSERATVRLTMQEGTSYQETKKHVERIASAANELKGKYSNDTQGELIEGVMYSVGGQGLASSKKKNAMGQSHRGEVVFEVTSPEERSWSVGTLDLIAEWREKIGGVIGAEELTYRGEIFAGKDPIDIVLASEDFEELEEASAEVKAYLKEIAGVFDVKDSLDLGTDEWVMRLKPQALAWGMSVEEVARQVRQAYYGEEVQYLQRGRDEIRVMLRYPQEARSSLQSLQEMMIRVRREGSDGRLTEVPLQDLVEIESRKALKTIYRVHRKRSMHVSADVKKEEVDMEAVEQDMHEFLKQVTMEYRGMTYSLEGESQEAAESNQSFFRGTLLVIFAIYAMLAIPFRSYLQPLLVMMVIPFGFIGALLGHIFLGQPLSMLSLFGIMALSGVVVNDSLVLVDYVNRRIREAGGKPSGEEMKGIISSSGGTRFRAVLLTSLTTFVGLLPLLAEKSTQAQVLKPMAISLAFGILFATFITLLLIPVAYMILEDVKRLGRGGEAR